MRVGQFGGVADGCIRVQPIAHLEQTLIRMEVAPEPFFKRIGIPRELFADPENTIPLDTVGMLLAKAALVTNCPHFGLLIGRDAPPEPLGMLGELLPHCADVGTALAYMHDYFHLHDRGAMPTRLIEGGTVQLGYAVLVPEIAGFDQIQDAALAIGMGIMRTLCGPAWKPRTAMLSRRRPADVRPYQAVFKCPLEFNCEHPALVFDREDLGKAIPGADGRKFHMLQSSLENISEENDLKFSAQVRRTVQAMLTFRRCSLDNVAAHFAMHRRSLNRRLAAEGGSYRALVDDVRRTLALRLMQHTDIALGDIAASLGYADASAFTRAFQRWEGMPPSAWQKR